LRLSRLERITPTLQLFPPRTDRADVWTLGDLAHAAGDTSADLLQSRGLGLTNEGPNARRNRALATIDEVRPDRGRKNPADGGGDETIQLKKSTSGWLAGNLLLGGIPGLVIDAATGGMYVREPKNLDLI
jgi:hypothetical protein